MSTEFARRLKRARKHARLTQKQLAPLAGMSQSNLSELETVAHQSGKTPQLAKACGVNSHWLATGEGGMLDPETPPIPANWIDSQTANAGDPAPSVAQNLSHPFAYAGFTTTAARVPVIGTLEMGESDDLHLKAGADGRTVGHVAAYSASPKAYAVRVIGDALYPVARHGACLVVEPGAECVPGELVLLEMMDGRFLVRELVTGRADSVTVLPVAGGRRDTLPRDEVRSIEPIANVVAGSKFTST